MEVIFFDDSITKDRADRCVTHHHACDCREYACRQRIEALEQMIAKFCACQNWATDAWKDQQHIKPLFDTAALLPGGE